MTPIKSCLYLFTLIFISSCATTYKGPLPDFSKSGAAAEEELKKFTFEEDFWRQGSFYRMGPNAEAHTLGSLRPVIEATSSDATRLLDQGETWHQATLIGAGIAVVSLAGAALSDHNSLQKTLYGTTIGASLFSLTSSFLSASKLKDGAVRFNKDLRYKFSPKISYNWKF